MARAFLSTSDKGKDAAALVAAASSPFGSVNSPPSGRYHTAAGDPVPSVTEILGDLGISGNFDGIPWEIIENKGKIGDAVHEEIARILANPGTRPLAFGGRVGKYLDSWHRWHFNQRRFTPVAVEVSYVSEGPLPFAGTMDCLARWNDTGGWVEFDWKTRLPAWYDGLQMAAYLLLAAANPKIPDYRVEDILQTERFIVPLNETLTKIPRPERYPNTSDFDDVMALIRAWHVRKRA